MKKNSRLKKYVELFKRNINAFLVKGIVVRSVAHPVEGDGAVFEFFLNNQGDDTELIGKVRPTIGRVLSEIPQKLVGGNIEGVKFSGTSLYLEGNRIVVIKGEDHPEAWSGSAVLEDVRRVVSTSQGSGRNDR
ncbi:hypothetical protein [Vreelandella sulfidaeris]